MDAKRVRDRKRFWLFLRERFRPMLVNVLGFVNLLCVGLLAGEELVIRYGVRAPIASLDEKPHLQLRQALIRTLRILVPTIFGSAFISGVAVAVLSHGPGSELRYAGLVALLAFISITLGGTVPINQAVLTWDVGAPPKDWKTVVERWERLDTARTWAGFLRSAFLGGGNGHGSSPLIYCS
jgi:Anthrone oxygenase